MNLARTTVIPVLTVKLIIIKYLQWSESVCRRGHGTSDSTPQRRFEVSPADLQIPWSFQAFFVPFCTQWVQNCCSSRHINTDSGPRWQLAATRVNQRTGQYHYSRMSKVSDDPPYYGNLHGTSCHFMHFNSYFRFSTYIWSDTWCQKYNTCLHSPTTTSDSDPPMSLMGNFTKFCTFRD